MISLNKLFKGEYTISYVFGRLDFFKKILLAKNRIFNKKKPKFYFGKKIIFKNTNKKIVDEINNYGFYTGIELNKSSLKKIISSIQKRRIFHSDSDGTVYSKFKKPIFLKNSRQQIPRGYVENVNKICEVNKIARDERILNIFYKYFGYFPQTVNPIILINYPMKMKDEDRLKFETIKYHYDMESPNSLYFSFYLCDVNETNAPHALIKKTHKNKPLKFVLKSAFVDEKKIFKHYSRKDELILKFSKGKGFIEDASIYHKNFPSKNKIRIMLQIRYY